VLKPEKRLPFLYFPIATSLENQRQSSAVSHQALLRIACRGAAIEMLVAFWFDGGLFTLALASLFWVLLQVGAEKAQAERCRLIV
jgi:hypothetical protein